MGRSPPIVETYVKKNGIASKYEYVLWSDEEADTLKKLLPTNSFTQVAEHIPGRNRNEVAGKARRMKLKKKKAKRKLCR